MRREILFRGKRVDNREWVTGFYVYKPNGRHLIYWQPFEGASQNTYHEVLPESIGQFTGLLDKNGVKIFEGDIVSGGSFNGSYAHGEVVFMDGGWFIIPRRKIEGIADLYLSVEYLEVVGNKLNNPELLEA